MSLLENPLYIIIYIVLYLYLFIYYFKRKRNFFLLFYFKKKERILGPKMTFSLFCLRFLKISILLSLVRSSSSNFHFFVYDFWKFQFCFHLSKVHLVISSIISKNIFGFLVSDHSSKIITPVVLVLEAEKAEKKRLCKIFFV